MRHLSQCFLVLLLAIPQTSFRFGSDLHGNEIRSLQRPDTRIIVLIFAASDCPISNGYVPEIARLNRLFPVKELHSGGYSRASEIRLLP